jgi:N4-gp56 family major capsid protein
MTMQTYGLNAGRINKFKGRILAHAIPREVLARGGRQESYPKNNGDTYVARRYLPFGAASTNASTMNTFFGTTTAVDRSALIVNAHRTTEGVTPSPDSITPVDVTVVIAQYSCLYGYTDKMGNLYEDDIPAEQVKQYGERTALVNEQVCFGALKACTNVFYGGTGTSRATTNGKLTLNLLRKVAKSLMANHAGEVTRVLKASPLFDTSAVAGGFIVYHSTDVNPDIRDLPGFVPSEKYASGTPMDNELGKCEEFRFIKSADMVSILDGGAAVGATGCQSNLGTSIDVYQIVVTGADAWSQIAVRGLDNNMNPTHLPPGTKDKSDPLGQRGYVGGSWWKAAYIENDGWMALVHVGVTALA